MLKKAVIVLVIMVLMYVCCKWPDEVVFVCEFGFTILKSIGEMIVDGVKDLISGTSAVPVA